ncbi:MAG TPA: YbaK/EbsC family protein [Niabella sp.]|nr:YbaK/EbsC family protein [Niabella sp.]HOZ96843.1 YbaK/EbsC family protein [Niabella sp.]HQW15051.1 YbaK/EbsC family protein [Niabella sp.]HQX20192.1 YbaK/EbsC family protein [Niabella sp.]HQX42695.1 YbaK/EbsC family protein [Niabella sp.]
MSLETAKAHLKKFGKENEIIALSVTTATVDTAAAALGVSGNEIAKSVTLYGKNDSVILVVAAGHQKIDSKKFKAHFGFKGNMIAYADVETLTGHPPGGVCPFGVKDNVEIYLDESLKKFDIVYPACGTLNTSIKLTISELEEIVNHKGWVDVTRNGVL